jgi:hypothetical protein
VLSLAGTNFDKSTKASIDNIAAKTTLVSSTKLSIVIPAHAIATGLKINLTSTYGNATSTDSVTYVTAIASVTPAYGNGTILDVITVKGTGFTGRTFGAGVSKSAVSLVQGGFATTVGGPIPAAGTEYMCGNVQVESNTVLTCSLTAAVPDGAYTVLIVDEDATTAGDIGAATAFSRAATYTVSDF